MTSNPQRYRRSRTSKRVAQKDVARYRKQGYGARTRRAKSGDYAVYRTSYRLNKRGRAKARAKATPAKRSRPAPKKSYWQRNFG